MLIYFAAKYFSRTARSLSVRIAFAKFARVHCASVLLATLLAFVAVPSARAQEPQPVEEASLDALAAKMADALAASKEKSVIVLDFIGPEKGFSSMGQAVADEFSKSLAKSSPKLKVIDRAKTAGEEERFSYTYYKDVGFQLADGINAKAVIFGRLTLEGSELQVVADSYQLAHRKRIGGFKVNIPLTDTMKPLIEKSIGGEDPGSFPPGGADGYSMPSCIYCPRANMTDDEARGLMTMGKGGNAFVLLTVVVGTNGLGRDIQMVKEEPSGLTGEAIAAVLRWRFKAATGPDGKPADVRVPIEVEFHIY